jgi:hypothetical protein
MSWQEAPSEQDPPRRRLLRNPGADGFVPVAEAAERMGVDEEQVRRLAAARVLTSVEHGGELLVRPAVVKAGGIGVPAQAGRAPVVRRVL